MTTEPKPGGCDACGAMTNRTLHRASGRMLCRDCHPATTFANEITFTAAEFASDAIDTLAAGPWETWQDEGDVPEEEPIPRLEVYHSKRIGWIEAHGDPRLGGTWRVVCGRHGARALINAIEVLKDQKKAAEEDGPAAVARWRRLMVGARALAKRLEPYAAPEDA